MMVSVPRQLITGRTPIDSYMLAAYVETGTDLG